MKNPNNTRIERFEKRRKNTKAISILLILGILLFIVLLWNILFGGNGQDTNESNDSQHIAIEENQSDENKPSHESVDEDKQEGLAHDSEDTNEEESEVTSEPVTIEQVEPSDENVIEAYTANWPPIQTEQMEPDIFNFDKEAQNRTEIETAIRSVTDLDENLVVWWLSNGGHQQVIGTVSDRQETEIYRVYLQWNDGEGWKPLKVERLKENDQKWRFQ